MESAGSLAAVLAGTASLILAVVVIIASAWQSRRRSARVRSHQQEEWSRTWEEIRSLTNRLTDEEKLSERDIEDLRRMARSLPDLNFPDSLSRQRRLRAEDAAVDVDRDARVTASVRG